MAEYILLSAGGTLGALFVPFYQELKMTITSRSW
jgi:hypothetical protein